MTQVDPGFAVAPVVRGDTFGNIPGDPMIIPRAQDGPQDAGQTVVAPEALRLSGHEAKGSGRLQIIRTDLRTPDRVVLAPLPSTREEFAMFQAERSLARRVAEAAPDAAGGADADTDTQAVQASNPAPGEAQVSNTVILRPAAERVPLWTDSIIETVTPRSPRDLLLANGFSDGDARRVTDRMEAAFQVGDTIAPGSLLAVRYRGGADGAARQVIQLSLYAPKGYVGSLGMAGSGQLVPAADAWADQPLLSDLLAREDGPGFQPQRLMDMIYSAALRAGLPPDQVGAAIAMMAKLHDLDAFADASDRLTVIRAEDGPDGSGPLLFIGLSGASGDKSCYVLRGSAGSGEDACFAPKRRVVATTAPLAPPVAGAMVQRFVPPGEGGPVTTGGAAIRRGYVIWSASQGVPVRAVAAGTVTALSTDKEFGHSIQIDHAGGMVSLYRGLGAVAPGLVEGAAVAAGSDVGVVGLPPGQKQPGLLFQLQVAGTPVDPALYLGGAVADGGSGAVEALIGRIIHVESAGNARARNPLSTASGLGQFIESTWLRMMQSYRPDLTTAMSRAELLELRFDPDMSREMVRRLAQENEAYLKARGHSISAGRLYLAHFLGPAGADQALRAPPSQSVLAVMGPGVVGANPFLRSYSIGDLQTWADRKMSGAAGAGAGASSQTEVVPVSAEVRQFINLMDQIRSAG